jgi:hypothetical protein
MSERLKEHDWKSCVLAKTGTEGSNPSLSARKSAELINPEMAKQTLAGTADTLLSLFPHFSVLSVHLFIDGRALRNMKAMNPVRSGRKQR